MIFFSIFSLYPLVPDPHEDFCPDTDPNKKKQIRNTGQEMRQYSNLDPDLPKRVHPF